MITIKDLLAAYRLKVDNLDLELLIAHELKKSREFVLAHPEYTIPAPKIKKLGLEIARRQRREPLAYILGHKEFYGLDFQVTPDTLIPRPETETLVELALGKIKETRDKGQGICVADVGTGSGNIIISLAKQLEDGGTDFYGIDISPAALKVARRNARRLAPEKRIKFLQGNLLEPVLVQNSKLKIQNSRILILANLPYLSQEIYSATEPDIKKFEPKSALYSGNHGLAHYEKLLRQIKKLKTSYSLLHVTCYLEISPEQKKSLAALVKKHLPAAGINFQKDLAGRWRFCLIEI